MVKLSKKHTLESLFYILFALSIVAVVSMGIYHIIQSVSGYENIVAPEKVRGNNRLMRVRLWNRYENDPKSDEQWYV